MSFCLSWGEVLAVIGPSGLGKSTALRCLNLLERADEGDIKTDGETLCCSAETGAPRYAAPAELRKIRLKLGLVFQSFNLFPHMNVLQNVTEAPRRRRPRDFYG